MQGAAAPPQGNQHLPWFPSNVHNLIILSQRQNVERALTELQAVPIVSFELCNETFLPIAVQGVVQAERPTQLAHTQVPLEPFGVVREGEALLALFPEGNGFAQPINELRRQEVKPVKHCLLLEQVAA